MLFRSLLLGPDAEQTQAEGEDVLFAGISKDAVGADTDEAGGEYVQEEALDEGERIEGHGFELTQVSVVFPLEVDGGISDREDRAVGDGDAVGVVTEVTQHAFW